MNNQLTLPLEEAKDERKNVCPPRISCLGRPDHLSGLDNAWHLWSEEAIEEERYYQGVK